MAEPSGSAILFWSPFLFIAMLWSIPQSFLALSAAFYGEVLHRRLRRESLREATDWRNANSSRQCASALS
jgi:hypothetical protein